jgi:selenide,water dikinase
VLKKPLGTGIVTTAIKAAMASVDLTDQVTRLMAISACTDVTGFGLLGHLAEMVFGSGTSVQVESGQVPVIAEAVEFASMGLIPAGAYKNKEFREAMIAFAENVPRALQDVLFDPQTSGGLLISVSEIHAAALVAALKDGGIDDAAQIGEIIDSPEEKIWII